MTTTAPPVGSVARTEELTARVRYLMRHANLPEPDGLQGDTARSSIRFRGPQALRRMAAWARHYGATIEVLYLDRVSLDLVAHLDDDVDAATTLYVSDEQRAALTKASGGQLVKGTTLALDPATVQAVAA